MTELNKIALTLYLALTCWLKLITANSMSPYLREVSKQFEESIQTMASCYRELPELER